MLQAFSFFSAAVLGLLSVVAGVSSAVVFLVAITGSQGALLRCGLKLCSMPNSVEHGLSCPGGM